MVCITYITLFKSPHVYDMILTELLHFLKLTWKEVLILHIINELCYFVLWALKSNHLYNTYWNYLLLLLWSSVTHAGSDWATESSRIWEKELSYCICQKGDSILVNKKFVLIQHLDEVQSPLQ